MLHTVVGKYLELIQTDTDREIVMTVIDTLSEMLDKIGQPVLGVEGATDAILTRMKEVFTHKVRLHGDNHSLFALDSTVFILQKASSIPENRTILLKSFPSRALVHTLPNNIPCFPVAPLYTRRILSLLVGETCRSIKKMTKIGKR